MNDIQKALMEKIKQGEITMVPRWQFVLRSVLYVAAAIVVAIVAIYLLSFILFALHRTGVLFAPLYGWNGILLLIVSSPWMLILAVGLFLGALYMLVTKYAFSYKKPLVYSLVGVVLFVIAVASIIQQTVLHERVGLFVTDRNLPALAPLYKNLDERKIENITFGKITSVSEEHITISTFDNQEYVVEISPRTKLPRGKELSIGDMVTVFGQQDKGIISAFGIRPMKDQQPQDRPGSGRPLPPPDSLY